MRTCVRAYVRVCVRARARVCVCACVHMCVRAYVCATVQARVCVCMHVYVCMYLCACERVTVMCVWVREYCGRKMFILASCGAGSANRTSEKSTDKCVDERMQTRYALCTSDRLDSMSRRDHSCSDWTHVQ